MIKKEIRTKQVNFRLTPAEYLNLQEQAQALGVSVSAYCQEVVTKNRVKSPKIAPEQAQAIAAALAKYGANLNQIARKLNQGGEMDTEGLAVLGSIRDGMREIWKKMSD